MLKYTIAVQFEGRTFEVRVHALGPVVAKRAVEKVYPGAKTRVS